MERKVLTGDAPRRRAVLADAGAEPVAAPAQGVLDFVKKPESSETSNGGPVAVYWKSPPEVPAGAWPFVFAEKDVPQGVVSVTVPAGAIKDSETVSIGYQKPSFIDRALGRGADSADSQEYYNKVAERYAIVGPTVLATEGESFAAAPVRFLVVGGWRLGMAPPCSGWWDYAVAGTDEAGRMWFELDAALPGHDGHWYQDQRNWASVPVCKHSDVAGTMRWRGLNEPWPEGYRYPVPAPGRRYRARLA
jgi:hypothetical protein